MTTATQKRAQLSEIEAHKFLTPEEADRVNRSFSDNALRMMRKRYLTKREDGTQETPSEMLHRIAHAVAWAEVGYGKSREEVEHWEREFFDIMANKEFTPAGRTITNAGAPSPVVANCIVLPVPDSMEGIFKTLKDAALLQKAGSGLGFSFGRLRPAGTAGPGRRAPGWRDRLDDCQPFDCGASPPASSRHAGAGKGPPGCACAHETG